METRIDKYKRIKKENRIKRLKFFSILFLILVLFLGIKIVNETARQIGCLTDSNILFYDFYEQKLEVLGRDFYINFGK